MGHGRRYQTILPTLLRKSEISKPQPRVKHNTQHSEQRGFYYGDTSASLLSDALLPATGVSAESPVALLPAEAVFPFGAHKGSTVAHVASVDNQHLAYFAGNYANYKRQKWLENTHPEFYSLLRAYCIENSIGTTPDVTHATVVDSKYRRW